MRDQLAVRARYCIYVLCVDAAVLIRCVCVCVCVCVCAVVIIRCACMLLYLFAVSACGCIYLLCVRDAV